MPTARQIKNQLGKLATAKRARINAWFFKTGKGGYGASDKFIGVAVPQQRKIAKQFKALGLTEIQKLLHSPIHEHRLTGLHILVNQYQRAEPTRQKKLCGFYLRHIQRVNNWDLVDSSAPYILGDYLLNRPRTILSRLSKSKSLWKRRIAIVSTFAFIKKNQFTDTLRIAKQLLSDKEDLIHKATGWMLREVGKRNQPELEKFLRQYAAKMPRTALRSAIEKFDSVKRKNYLKA